MAFNIDVLESSRNINKQAIGEELCITSKNG